MPFFNCCLPRRFRSAERSFLKAFEVRRSRFDVPGPKENLEPRTSNLERGFTLLEVMMAMVILAIALPVLLGLRNRDVELVGYADSITTATLLAQEKLFETELMGFPPTGEQTGAFENPPPGSSASMNRKERGAEVRDVRSFRWTRTVAATPLDDVREVRIRIAWLRGKIEETVEVTSYVFLAPPRQS